MTHSFLDEYRKVSNGPVKRAQVRTVVVDPESAESGPATNAGQDSPLSLTLFPLIIHQVFQYVCYSQVLNENACAF